MTPRASGTVESGARTMHALIKAAPAPGLTYGEAPRPSYGARDVLLQVEAMGICGTDLHIYRWDAWAASRIKPPLIIGHEFVGRVVAVGDEVTHVAVGQRVSAEGHLYCGLCYACRTGLAHVCERGVILGVDVDGGHAEFARVPEQNVWPVPREMPLEIAAILDPIGNAVHVALTAPVAGATVAIVGCGPIGCMAAALARAMGARRVIGIDVNSYRLELAAKLGATHLVESGREEPVEVVRSESQGRGADVVWEMSGHPSAIQQAFQMLRRGGDIVLFGLPSAPVSVDLTNAIIFRAATVHGVNGRRIFHTWYAMEGLLLSGKVDLSPVITHRKTLAEIDEVMALMSAGIAGKIVLMP
jgi:threonine 3-dehydrogenase